MTLTKPHGFFAFIIGTILFLLSVHVISASDQFSTNFNLVYVISKSGLATTQYDVELINKFSDIYATEYALEIGSTRISNIQAFTSQGQSIPFSINPTDNSTIITLVFDSVVVGKGKSQNFSISFSDPDASALHGQILEVNIPKLDNLTDIDNLHVLLKIPAEFSLPALTHPPQYDLSSEPGLNIFTFTKSYLQDGVTALFGHEQVLNFTLNYHLENTTSSNGLSQIAIPPDTSYQKIYYSFLEPRPKDINLDIDGNWIATYLLKPKQKLNVVAQGQVHIFLEPQLHPAQIKPNQEVYLNSQPFWPTQDPEVQKIASQLSSAADIYQYLVDNFSYDYTRVDSATNDRFGAAYALSHPQSSLCQEFTDSFIALARAKNIPAREHNGFALTENSQLRPLSLVQDILHAWPEYYDDQVNQWIPIDPTWGNTTGGIDYFHVFDLNHFTFVIHGVESSNPLSAGYYKFEDSIGKDIIVDFAQNVIQPSEDFEFRIEQSPLNFFHIPAYSTLFLTNHSGVAYYQLPLNLSSLSLKPSPSLLTIDTLLPFTTISSRIKLTPQGIFTSSNALLNIQTESQTYEYQIDKFHNQAPWFFPVFTISLVSFLVIFSYLTWSILVSQFKKRSALRRKS